MSIVLPENVLPGKDLEGALASMPFLRVTLPDALMDVDAVLRVPEALMTQSEATLTALHGLPLWELRRQRASQ